MNGVTQQKKSGTVDSYRIVTLKWTVNGRNGVCAK